VGLKFNELNRIFVFYPTFAGVMLNRNDHRIELIVNEAQQAWSFLLYILPPAGIGWFSVVTHLTLSNAHEKEAPKKTTVAAAVVGRTGRSTRLAEWREESFSQTSS
jgi:hypothetical protein